ncbi:magnesium transporter [Desulfuribacillus alkaliarsenatis]|uniref:Magnesium transporter MgtE n=1 Tax=Desulfuribacillus alkaliarsenatis TaxID=766136 RepID=A0A1E5G3U9_9FIRM|nr:magnesium transporter [Desulfuribacillus alkaliarsenatis]OEF97754.1 magnesium transporter [Desulfuribacillus alkaliarsenatis]
MVKLDQHTVEQYTQLVIYALNGQNKGKFRELFLELHPTDQVELFSGFDEVQKALVVEYLTPEEFAEIFQGMESEDQKEVVRELEDGYASEMLSNMYTDDLVSFLGELEEQEAKDIIEQLDIEDAKEINEILNYEPDSAGSIMTTEYISICTSDTASKVMERLREQEPEAETIYYLYVVNQVEELVGVLSLRDLLFARLDQKIEDIMSTRIVSVNVKTDQEEVAKLIKKYDFLAIPVVKDDGKLVGIVTVDDVMDIIEEEVAEDFGEITATKGSSDVNISSFQAAKMRAPWILILMFLGLVTAGIIGQFEDTLATIVLLAAFIPMIMGSAGNTGTQALAVMVRSIAIGQVNRSTVRQLIRREFGTGIILGIICAIALLVIIPVAYFTYDAKFMLAFIVAFSLLCTLSIATMIGAIIPILINKLKIDPAVASGPFITTLNDIIGLLIYFYIATMFLEYL